MADNKTLWRRYEIRMGNLGHYLVSEVQKAHNAALYYAGGSQKAEVEQLKPGSTVPRHETFTILGDEWRAAALRSYNERWSAIHNRCEEERKAINPHPGEGPDQRCATALALLQLRPEGEVSPEEIGGLMDEYGDNFIAARSIQAFARGRGTIVRSELLDAVAAIDRCEKDAEGRCFSVLNQREYGEGETEGDATFKTRHIQESIDHICTYGTSSFLGAEVAPSDWTK